MATLEQSRYRTGAVALMIALVASMMALPAGLAGPSVTVPNGFVAYVDVPDAVTEAQVPGPTLVDENFTVHVYRVAFDDDGDGIYEEHHDFDDAHEDSPNDYDCDEDGLSALLVSIEDQEIQKVDSQKLGADCEATFDVPAGTDGPNGLAEGFAIAIWTPSNRPGSHHGGGRLSSYFAPKNRVGPASADIMDVSTRHPAFTTFTPLFEAEQTQPTTPDGFVAYVDLPDAETDATLPGPTIVNETFTVHVPRVGFDDDGNGQYEEHHDFDDANEEAPNDYDCDEDGLVAILVSISDLEVQKLDSQALGADCEAEFDLPSGSDGPDLVGEGFAVTIWTPTSQDGSDRGRLSSYFAAKNRVGPASADILDVSTRQPAFTSFTPVFGVTAA